MDSTATTVEPPPELIAQLNIKPEKPSGDYDPLKKLREKTRKAFWIAIVNLVFAIILFLIKVVDVCILAGIYENPRVSFYQLYVALYGVNDRQVYFPDQSTLSTDDMIFMFSFYSVSCDLLGFFLYLVGSCLLLVSSSNCSQNWAHPGTRKALATSYATLTLICLILTFLPKWIAWGEKDLFVQPGQAQVVCTGPALLLWVPVGESTRSIVSARSLLPSLEKSLERRKAQICETFPNAFDGISVQCTCSSYPFPVVVFIIVLMHLILMVMWTFGIFSAFWVIRLAKAELKQISQTPSEVPRVKEISVIPLFLDQEWYMKQESKPMSLGFDSSYGSEFKQTSGPEVKMKPTEVIIPNKCKIHEN